MASGELVGSLLGGSALNYVGHRACVRKASQLARRANISIDLAEFFRWQEKAGGQDKNRLHGATRNGSCLSVLPYRINGTELSQEEFRDNLRLRYGLMPQDIPATSMVAVRSSQLSTPYHAQRVALFWRSTTTPKKIGRPRSPVPRR